VVDINKVRIKQKMNQEIIEAFREIASNKNIERELIVDIIENIFYSMIKKKYGDSENFDVIVNMDKGDVEIYNYKVIVDKVEDPNKEIDLESARKIEPDLEVGDDFVEIVDPASFGRRLIVSAKQNLTQKIKEAEKEVIYEEFINRVGEIIIGDVHQINRREILISLERTEVVLPRQEQIYTERYKRGDSIRAIIKEVKRTPKGPEIIASRTDPKFLIRLFELEVPEIYDGIIEIKAVAREPGDRAKIAVESNDKRIDPVGACVGMKGVRIQSIVRELNNEKIDIINYSSDPIICISRALSPAKPVSVNVDRENKTAIAIIPDDQISLAIGKNGQNIRLASVLTGYEIETIKESDVSGKEKGAIDLTMVDGLTEKIINKLIREGFETAEEVLDTGEQKLKEIPGIGEKTAKKIMEVLNTYFE